MNNNRETAKTDAGVVFTPNATSKRILLVEDNDLNRQMLNDYLVFCGYQVLSLAHGAGFIEVVYDFQPDIILLDLKLPDINGYVLLEQIQKIPELRSIPVIVVSAFAFKADKQRAFSLGAKQYLVKPMNLSDLKQAIQKELSS